MTLTVTDTKSEKQLALKLHCQFDHPCEEKLLQLITNAGPLRSNNKELINEVKHVPRSCPTCKIYRKPPVSDHKQTHHLKKKPAAVKMTK